MSKDLKIKLYRLNLMAVVHFIGKVKTNKKTEQKAKNNRTNKQNENINEAQNKKEFISFRYFTVNLRITQWFEYKFVRHIL